MQALGKLPQPAMGSGMQQEPSIAGLCTFPAFLFIMLLLLHTHCPAGALLQAGLSQLPQLAQVAPNADQLHPLCPHPAPDSLAPAPAPDTLTPLHTQASNLPALSEAAPSLPCDTAADLLLTLSCMHSTPGQPQPLSVAGSPTPLEAPVGGCHVQLSSLCTALQGLAASGFGPTSDAWQLVSRATGKQLTALASQISSQLQLDLLSSSTPPTAPAPLADPHAVPDMDCDSPPMPSHPWSDGLAELAAAEVRMNCMGSWAA